MIMLLAALTTPTQCSSPRGREFLTCFEGTLPLAHHRLLVRKLSPHCTVNLINQSPDGCDNGAGLGVGRKLQLGELPQCVVQIRLQVPEIPLHVGHPATGACLEELLDSDIASPT